MRFTLVAAVLVLGLLQPSSGRACSFNTDCEVGSKCLKESGQIYGICVGGMNPGNDNDAQPVYSPTDPNGTLGDTCDFDVDCGPGSRCVKESGRIHGVCIR